MSWFQRRSRNDDESSARPVTFPDEEEESHQLWRESYHPWQHQCFECSEAPPGAPPCVFCAFAQPGNFYGVISTALKLCGCKYCRADGQTCDICFAYHRRGGATSTTSEGVIEPPVTGFTAAVLAADSSPGRRSPAGVGKLGSLSSYATEARIPERRSYGSHPSLTSSPPLDESEDRSLYPSIMATPRHISRGYYHNRARYPSPTATDRRHHPGASLNSSPRRAVTNPTVAARQTHHDQSEGSFPHDDDDQPGGALGGGGALASSYYHHNLQGHPRHRRHDDTSSSLSRPAAGPPLSLTTTPHNFSLRSYWGTRGGHQSSPRHHHHQSDDRQWRHSSLNKSRDSLSIRGPSSESLKTRSEASDYYYKSNVVGGYHDDDVDDNVSQNHTTSSSQQRDYLSQQRRQPQWESHGFSRESVSALPSRLSSCELSSAANSLSNFDNGGGSGRFRIWSTTTTHSQRPPQTAGPSAFRRLPPGEPSQSSITAARRSHSHWRSAGYDNYDEPPAAANSHKRSSSHALDGVVAETTAPNAKRKRPGTVPGGDSLGTSAEPRLVRGFRNDAIVTGSTRSPRRGGETSSAAAPRGGGVNRPGAAAAAGRGGGGRSNKRNCLCGSSQPNFGLPGEPASSARWCSNCPDKPPQAVNVKNKRCLCGSSQPSFGLPAGSGRPTVARWCSKCPDKPANAVDVKHKRCVCSASIPNFGLPGEPATAARWCSKCPDKPPNAIDVKNKRCECGASQPSLGLPGDPPTAARWCSKCPRKPPNAVGVKSKRCKCGISQPSFGLPGERATLARWCNKCPDKAPNAVNLKSKKCRCGSSVPSFGLLGEPPAAARWCSKCPDKPENAIDVKNNKRCACRNGVPAYGLPGREPITLLWCSLCPGKPSNAVHYSRNSTTGTSPRTWL